MRTSIMPGIRRLRRGSPPKRPHKKKRTKSDQKPDIGKKKSILFSEAAWTLPTTVKIKNRFHPSEPSVKRSNRASRRVSPSSAKKRPRPKPGKPNAKITFRKETVDLHCEECACQPRKAQHMSLEEYEIFLGDKEVLMNNFQLEATFPKFSRIVTDQGSEIPKSELFCFMTEIQLQAILDN